MTIEFVFNALMSYVDFLVTWGPFIVITAGVGIGSITCWLQWSKRRWLKRQSVVWLEITPPSSVDKTPDATQQLFAVVHGMREARSLGDRLLRRVPTMSFEITSTRSGGIRYLVRVGNDQAELLEKTIASYVPDAKVREVSGPGADPIRVIEFKATSHYVLPLTLSSAMDQHDPLLYVTGAMTKLGDDESITLQLVVQPVVPGDAAKLARQIMTNGDVLSTVRGLGHGSFAQKLLNGMGSFALGITSLASDASAGILPGYTSTSSRSSSPYAQNAAMRQQVSSGQRPARTLSSFELELMESMHQKITQPLFQVNIRVCISGDNAKVHSHALRSVLDGYSVPSYQSLRAKSRVSLLQRYRTKLASLRLPSISRRSSLILSASELASLYHFPPGRFGRTDNLVSSLSKTLPAPISLKSGHELAVVIGQNLHHGITTPIGLTEKERERHIYIIGGTGNGKTTMLQYMIVQDMRSGKGVAVVDPHGDMAETLLTYVPPERIKDVIYFNPDDLSYPIGMNLLELRKGLTGDDLLREKDLITEATVSIFRKIFSDDDAGGHRIEYMLRNAVQTALTQKNATLFTVYDLINDPTYRNKVVAGLEDKNLKNFWRNEFGNAGGMQRVKMAAGITSKIGRFLFSASAKRILEQPVSTIDFDDIITSGKILICNFSKGLIGEDTSELMGIMVLAKLQLTSLRQARIKQADRRPFYLYVDEFQNFATPSFVQMLSESRKYKLHLIMAEQSTSQQDDRNMVNIILANVGTVVCFRTGNPADEQALLQMFAPYVETGEIAHLPSFSYYVHIAAIQSQEPLSGETLLLDESSAQGDTTREAIVDSSRRTHAREYNVENEKNAKQIKVQRVHNGHQSKKLPSHPSKSLPSK